MQVISLQFLPIQVLLQHRKVQRLQEEPKQRQEPKLSTLMRMLKVETNQLQQDKMLTTSLDLEISPLQQVQMILSQQQTKIMQVVLRTICLMFLQQTQTRHLRAHHSRLVTH